MRAEKKSKALSPRLPKAFPKGAVATVRVIRPALLSLWDNLQATLHDESFGLLRIVRVLLTGICFVDPFMWLCHLADMISLRAGKVFTDIFVLLKLAFPLTLLVVAPSSGVVLTALCVYIIIETLLYVWGTVLSGDSIDKPASAHRSLLLLIIGFFAVNMAFAWLYFQTHQIKGMNTTLDGVYFSLVTAATVGFGDMVALDGEAKRIVIFQIFGTVSYLTVFFARYLGTLDGKKGAGGK